MLFLFKIINLISSCQIILFGIKLLCNTSTENKKKERKKTTFLFNHAIFLFPLSENFIMRLPMLTCQCKIPVILQISPGFHQCLLVSAASNWLSGRRSPFWEIISYQIAIAGGFSLWLYCWSNQPMHLPYKVYFDVLFITHIENTMKSIELDYSLLFFSSKFKIQTS